MTVKEKAKELFNNMLQYQTESESDHDSAKFSALICVDEIINCDTYFNTSEDSREFTKYWKEVQQEINKL